MEEALSEFEPGFLIERGLFFDGVGWPNGQGIGPDTIAAELQAVMDTAV